MSRTLVWFSCGIASALAAKISVARGECEVLYCDTLAHEHPDNLRFMKDVEQWIGQEILILKSEKYSDIFDVFKKTGWLIGPGGARCTTELKKMVRIRYQRPDDTHVFGFTSDEQKRVDRFHLENPELEARFPLLETGIDKEAAKQHVSRAGIEIPTMYKLGFDNNNCIGCVKGGMGYWNRVRRLFPEHYNRMAKVEREMGVAICHKEGPGRKRIKMFLDELPPDAGRGMKEPDIECGVLCTNQEESQ